LKIEPIRGGVKVCCPAKVNLSLEVTGRRPDGYHDIETVMETISIFDEVEIRPSGGGIHIECDDPDVPRDSSNTAWRAAELMMPLGGAGGRSGVEIAISKRIPLGGGLGGGSSNAAAVLAGLDQLWGLDMPQKALMGFAAQIGSDVPFFTVGGTALCRGRGEIVQSLHDCGKRAYVVLYPGIAVSTRDVYMNIKRHLTGPLRRANILIDFLQAGGQTREAHLGRAQKTANKRPLSVAPGEPPLYGALFNRLETTAIELYPELESARQAMRDAGLSNVMLTGSGSCFFSLCRNLEDARSMSLDLAEKVARHGGQGAKVFHAETAI